MISIGDDAFIRNNLTEINTYIPGGKTSTQIGITQKIPKEKNTFIEYNINKRLVFIIQYIEIL